MTVEIEPPPLRSELVGPAGLTPPWQRWLQRIHERFRTDDWHHVGDAGEPAFGSTFQNYSAATNATEAAFRLDSKGKVHIKGFITGGAPGNDFWQMPANYQPSEDQHFLCAADDGTNTAPVLVVIRSNGDVEFNSDLTLTWVGTINTSWVDLAPVTYFVDNAD